MIDMQEDEQEMQTLHVYISKEEVKRPSLFPVALSLFCLSVLVTLFALIPYKQPVVRTTIRVQAVFLPLQVYNASTQIQATGIKTYPAIVAHGVLTITNGSVIAAILPSGMIVTASDGTQVVTQSSVYVPAGSALGYGYATVKAQAVTSGKQGNIPVLAINAVYGTSLYIRNLSAFTGGKDSYSLQIVTAQDRQTAISAARAFLTPLLTKALLAYPCREEAKQQNNQITLTWICQYVRFSIPAYMHLIAYQIVGKRVFVEVWYKQHPPIYNTK